jgi:Kinesin motor domain
MSVPSSDCVQVAVRVRPFVPSELDRGCQQIVEKTLAQEQLKITGESYSKSEESYTFNNVFMMNESQEGVYSNSVKPMIESLFQGFNVTILAYG